MEFEERTTGGTDWTFVDAYKLICGLWQSQKNGLPLGNANMKHYDIRLPQFQVSEIMALLESAKWVQGSAGGAWILCRDLAEVTVMDLYRIIPRRLPLGDSAQPGDNWTGQLYQLVSQHNEDLENRLAMPLRDLLTQAEQSENRK